VLVLASAVLSLGLAGGRGRALFAACFFRMGQLAIEAVAIERDVMAFDSEAGRSELGQVAWAALHIEYTLTAGALEVVVVGMARAFVAWALSRQLHERDGLIFQQQLQIAVDGGQPESFHVDARRFQHLLR